MPDTSQRRSKKWEWAVYGAFILLFCIVSYFHEPWFDEAEAWQIAKCASLKEILFFIPHYEGHPPLWHLLLLLPAKLGVPFELGLKMVGAVPVFVSVWLLLFRSPFPRPVRLILPFNYFVFYQYGVISRPYSLMLLSLLLAAFTFREKDRRPWPFVLSLLLLCLTSAYGIVLAGGICIAWVWDIWKEHGWKLTAPFWKDRRVHALMAILVAALLLIAEFFPQSDTLGVNYDIQNSPFIRLIYTCFVMLPDCVFFDFLSDSNLFNLSIQSIIHFLPAVIVGFFFLFLTFCISAPRKRKYFFIPYLLFEAFSAFIYIFRHHIGIVYLFLLFWMWINLEDTEHGKLWEKVKSALPLSDLDRKQLKQLSLVLTAVFLLVPTWWSLSASVSDIRHPYFFSRDTAAFLKESGLTEARILAPWSASSDDEEGKDIYDTMNTKHVTIAASLNAYFENNIIMNLNHGLDEYAYVRHYIPTREENIRNIEAWQSEGFPDVLIGFINLEKLYPEETDIPAYVPVFKMQAPRISIWKADYTGEEDFNYTYVFLRKDLLEQYGLQEIR